MWAKSSPDANHCSQPSNSSAPQLPSSSSAHSQATPLHDQVSWTNWLNRSDAEDNEDDPNAPDWPDFINWEDATERWTNEVMKRISQCVETIHKMQTPPEWYEKIPDHVFLIVTNNLDTLKLDGFHMLPPGEPQDREFKDFVYQMCSGPLEGGDDSPFYHTTDDYWKARKEVQENRHEADPTIVSIPLRKLCADGRIPQCHVIDLRTEESQREYFENSGFWFSCPLGKLIEKQKLLLCWKGWHVHSMKITDQTGNSEGNFIDHVEDDKDTGGYKWKPTISRPPSKLSPPPPPPPPPPWLAAQSGQ